MKGKVTVRCTVPMASGKFIPFFEVVIISFDQNCHSLSQKDFFTILRQSKRKN